jgi:isopenicillin-N epimerase
MTSTKQFFMLDPEVIFLNHGSFGACPREVFETYQEWQRRLERQPVLFLGRELVELDRDSRSALGSFLNVDPEDMVYIPNATHGVNIVARSLNLGPGDEILSTNHEYGACDNIWHFISQKTGAVYIQQPIQLPTAGGEEIFEQVWKRVTNKTRLIFISHITSSTAVRMPVEALCQRARQSGILTLVDGAHAPGQLPLNLNSVGADFYTGNCHKWMMAPKGSAFLYARKEAQPLLEPLVVSWGYRSIEGISRRSYLQEYFQWTGTRDPAAALAVPAAIRFMKEHHWEQTRQTCHILLKLALEQINSITGLESIYRNCTIQSPMPPQIGSAYLPPETDLGAVKEQLYIEHRIEIPLIEWQGKKMIRVSVQGYNTVQDIEALITALSTILKMQKSQ